MNQNTNVENPRAIMGDNMPDYGKIAGDQMKKDYSGLEATQDELLVAADQITEVVDEDGLGIASRLYKRLGDVAGQANAFREKEKEPYLRGGNAVDQFFFAIIDKLKRRDKKAKPGAADRLYALIDAYQQRKLAEERAKRERDAAEALRIETAKRDAATKAAREAEELRLAAERARKPEIVVEKDSAAKVAEAKADETKVDATVATIKADEALAQTRASSADMVRTRVDGGPLNTMGKEAFAEVVNVMELDKAMLWPFINQDEIAKALRSWAKVTGHKVEMKGANIGFRDKSVIR